MDWSFFGLKESPFNVTPDPTYFYLGLTHEGALSNLIYGIGERKGFLLITGEVGTGKTTLCRALVSQLDRKTHSALILSSNLGRDELVRMISADFGLPGSGGTVELLEGLNAFLLERLEKGENAVVVLDEAQNLSDETLEQLRLISNLETDREKLLQIVLVGQPELREKIRQPHLRQLDQRIAVRYHLRPLTEEEMEEYVHHRIQVASVGEPRELFSRAALKALFRVSRGYPRLVNALADRTLALAAAAGVSQADTDLVRRAGKDLDLDVPPAGMAVAAKGRYLVPAALLVAGLLFVFTQFSGEGESEDVPSFQTPPPIAGQSEEAGSAPSGREAPATSPAPERGKRDGDGVVRTANEGESLNAALATLFSLWKMDYLAEESLRWKIFNFHGGLLQVYFRETGIVRQYGIDFYGREADAEAVRALGLPFLAGVRDPVDPEKEKYIILAGLQGDEAVIFDPLEGKRTEPLGELLEKVSGTVYYLIRGEGGAQTFKPKQKGSAVMALQEKLQTAGFLRGKADGSFGPLTSAAVRALQRRYGLEEDGIAGVDTMVVLMRLTEQNVPLLEK